MHDCEGREVRDLIRWRGEVVSKLKYMEGLLRNGSKMEVVGTCHAVRSASVISMKIV